jgi:hypothetical protein
MSQNMLSSGTVPPASGVPAVTTNVINWSGDGKVIENIMEFTASFHLGLVCVKQEMMESPALIWQCE